MGKPEDIPQDVLDAATAHTTFYLNPSRGADFQYTVMIVARAILAAKAEERNRWQPAVTYFDRYCQDEADDVENCVCGVQQHEDAKAFAAIRKREG